MDVIKFKDKYLLNKCIVSKILSYMSIESRSNIAFMSGSTSVPIYNLLVSNIKQKNIKTNTHYYVHNEIPLVPSERGGLVLNHLNEYLFNPLNIDRKRIHSLNEDSYRKLDDEIMLSGGLDLVVLSMGDDGHIAANYPSGNNWGGIRKSELNPDDMLYANLLKDEGDPKRVTEHYFTLGLETILKARNVIIVAYGKNKSDVLKLIDKGVVDEMIPATIMNIHPSCSIYTTEETFA